MSDIVSFDEGVVAIYPVRVTAGGGEELGWSAVAFQRVGKQLLRMVVGQFSEAEGARRRIGAIRAYVSDWELVSGVRRDLAEICEKYASSDGLPGEWESM